MADLKHWLANTLGNFGIYFFAPLSGSTVIQSWITHSINMQQSVLTGLATAIIMTGLSLSYELKHWSNKGKFLN